MMYAGEVRHTRSSGFENTKSPHQVQERIYPQTLCSQLNNTIILSNIYDPSTKLLSERLDSIEMQILGDQSFRSAHSIGMSPRGI